MRDRSSNRGVRAGIPVGCNTPAGPVNAQVMVPQAGTVGGRKTGRRNQMAQVAGTTTTPDPRSEEGFSLVEVLAAMSLFALLMTVAAMGLSEALDLTRNNRSRSAAANLAAREMDLVRSTRFTELPVGLVSSTEQVDGVAYTIRRESQWVSEDATTGSCSAPTGSTLAFLRVTVSVTWPNMNGTAPVTSQTALTPPVGAYDPTTGHVAVSVVDRGAAPLAGIPVFLTGPTLSRSQLTTSDGCAFFAYLPSDAYMVTVSSTGYVDGQGIPAPEQSATVTVGSTVSVQFDYDRAASLQLTLVGTGGGSPPDTMPLTVANTHLLPTGLRVVPGSGGATRTVGDLFPYADGYQVWAGGCTDADPGAAREAPLQVLPGQSSSATIGMPSVQAQVTLADGITPVAGAILSVRHAPDGGCPAGEVLTLPGVTDASGSLLVSIPYGTWTFEVTGRAAAGSWPILTLSPPASGSPTQVSVKVS
jgi:prepilin-type N-terminal cleavage/methylation domain-containing protein